jgi:hypothetical protein
MKGFGILLLVIGILILLVGVGMDTTVPTELGERRVHNFGLMNQKQNTILFGGVISIIGAVFVGFGSRSRPAAPIAPDAADTRSCPYCAELIKKQAIVCRFCNRELSVSSEPAPPAATHDELMAQYGISNDGSSYIYGQYRYNKLEDAVAYAQKQKA